MTMQLIPTRAGMRAMDGLGLTWAEVLLLLDHADREQPCLRETDPGRRQHLSGDYILFTARGAFEGEECLYLLGVSRKRIQEELEEDRGLWVEQAGPKSNRRGGAGRLLPTSFKEILQRITDTPGWSYEMGGKHIRVTGPEGQRGTIPITESDHRSLANNVSQLRKIGLDVRRRTVAS